MVSLLDKLLHRCDMCGASRRSWERHCRHLQHSVGVDNVLGPKVVPMCACAMLELSAVHYAEFILALSSEALVREGQVLHRGTR